MPREGTNWNFGMLMFLKLPVRNVYLLLRFMFLNSLNKNINCRFYIKCNERLAARVGEGRGVYRVLVGKPEGKETNGETQTFCSQSRNSRHFMETEYSLPHSQVPATCPYPEPPQSSPYPPHPTFWRSIIILSSHLLLCLPSCLLPSGFPTKTLHTPLLSPIRATCPAHLILLDLITRTIFGEQYRSLSSSLCSFLYSPVT